MKYKKKIRKALYGVGEGLIDNRTEAQKLAWQPLPTQLPFGVNVDNGKTVTDVNGNVYMKVDPNQMRPASISPFPPDKSKTEYRGTGVYDLHPAFAAADLAMTATTFAANQIGNGRKSRKEKLKYIDALQPQEQENDFVTNANPMYMQTGGAALKPKVEAEGGEVYTDTNQNVIEIPDQAPSHEEGGVNLHDVDRVLEDTSTSRFDKSSKLLRITPLMFKDMFGMKTNKTLSHAEALKEVSQHVENKSKTFSSRINKALESLNKVPTNVYAKNSMELNLQTAQSLPSEKAVFDMLFNHQEEVKSMHNIKNPKAKYGGYVAKYGVGEDVLDPHKGDKNSGVPNASKYTKEQWENFAAQAGYTGDINDNLAFQKFLHTKYKDIVDAWHDPNKNPLKLGLPNEGMFDGKLGVRWDGIIQQILTPPETNITVPDDSVPATGGNPAPAPIKNPTGETPDFQLQPSGSPSQFKEPLRWFDVASPLMSLADSGRIQAQYNPAEFNKVRLKLHNPTPALQAGQRNYNALLNVLPNSGAGMANATNAFSQKYALDQQVLGQYSNMNVPIENTEELTNQQIMAQQSASNQQSRGIFEQHRLASMEAQRQQKRQDFKDLFSTIAMNRKLNREGNLLMQMFPNFNSYGQFNGNQRVFRNPVPTTTPGGLQSSYVTDPQSGLKYRVIIDSATGKLVSSSKMIPDNKSVGATSGK